MIVGRGGGGGGGGVHFATPLPPCWTLWDQSSSSPLSKDGWDGIVTVGGGGVRRGLFRTLLFTDRGLGLLTPFHTGDAYLPTVTPLTLGCQQCQIRHRWKRRAPEGVVEGMPINTSYPSYTSMGQRCTVPCVTSTLIGWRKWKAYLRGYDEWWRQQIRHSMGTGVK